MCKGCRGYFAFAGSRSLIPTYILLFSSLVLMPGEAYSQSNTARIFDRAAASKAADFRSGSERGGGYVIEELRPDTAESIRISNQIDAGFFGEYKGLSYINYVRDIVGSTSRDEDEEQSYAQKVLLYSSASLLGKSVQDSPLDTHYRGLLDKLKVWRRKTTLQVVQASDGDLGVNKGELKEESLLELKLHASARDGLETRLSLGKNLILRVDPVQRDTLLEYFFGF